MTTGVFFDDLFGALLERAVVPVPRRNREERVRVAEAQEPQWVLHLFEVLVHG